MYYYCTSSQYFFIYLSVFRAVGTVFIGGFLVKGSVGSKFNSSVWLKKQNKVISDLQ